MLKTALHWKPKVSKLLKRTYFTRTCHIDHTFTDWYESQEALMRACLFIVHIVCLLNTLNYGGAHVSHITRKLDLYFFGESKDPYSLEKVHDL